MTTYVFKPMTKEYAMLISRWQYDAPYSIYSMDGSEDCVSELMNGDYFYVMNNIEIVGFICIRNSARVSGGYEIGIYNRCDYLDVGLGMRPNMTGRGRGLEFLTASINYLSEAFEVQNFQLVVATFNQRAIKVYERAGFTKGKLFMSKVEDKEIEFLVMSYSIK